MQDGGGVDLQMPDGAQGASSADPADQEGDREIKESEEDQQIHQEADPLAIHGVEKNLSERSQTSLQKL